MTDVAPLRRPTALNRLTGRRGDLLAEFFGTFLLIALGDACVAMAVAGLPGSGRTAGATTIFQGSGDWLLIVWGWAFAVAFAVYVAGGVSGAHLNPAVTLAMAVRRRFPWRKVPGYWGAQLAGAFAGAALVYAVYHPAISAFEAAAGESKGETTFSIFATVPAPYFSGWFGPLLDQVVGTAVLLAVVLALIDARSKAMSPKTGPLLIGFTVAAIGLSYGANAGYAINPARDFGPRLFAFFAGWGDTAMSSYLWVPIVGPLVGGVLGALLYDFFIGDVLHARQVAEEKFTTS
ncbi:MIP/aquaporin family protein [Amycolatopsis endophytica]|uniref:Glycerol uptake facilitator protein n=1 Tax=Amycolatopsis endophytica TaxID=860233 RepID=A0A853B3U3_9PSEU|nr:MIP/aquaporin family protein [Amycolatopsis endophytica]NYI89474.1 glycerol uptake facilitator protein [Amycolatopsis endophytica]